MELYELSTERTHLKKLEESDFTELKEYMIDPYVMRYFDHGVMSDEQILDFLNHHDRVFPIVLDSENKIIGHIILGKWFAPETFEIGWVLNSKYHNQGLITEVADAVLRYAFENLKVHRLIATCQPENIASKRICEKIGLRLEGWFRKCIYIERLDEWWDELFFALLDEEYMERK